VIFVLVNEFVITSVDNSDFVNSVICCCTVSAASSKLLFILFTLSTWALRIFLTSSGCSLTNCFLATNKVDGRLPSQGISSHSTITFAPVFSSIWLAQGSETEAASSSFRWSKFIIKAGFCVRWETLPPSFSIARPARSIRTLISISWVQPKAGVATTLLARSFMLWTSESRLATITLPPLAAPASTTTSAPWRYLLMTGSGPT